MPDFTSIDQLQQPSSRSDAAGSTSTYRWVAKTTDGMTLQQARQKAIDRGYGPGTPNPEDPSEECLDLQVEPYGYASGQTGPKSQWLLTQRFGVPPAGLGSQNPDPLSRPPEIEWYGESELRPILYDYSSPDRLPIVNTSGERFENDQQREFGELACRYTRNEVNPNLADIRDYMHAVNSGTFTIDGFSIPAGYAKLHVDTIQKLHENGVTYYRVTYVFRFKAGGWNPVKILNYGYTAWLQSDPISGAHIFLPIWDGVAGAVRKPYPLNADGTMKDSPTDTPAELEFNFYESKDFSVFSFS